MKLEVIGQRPVVVQDGTIHADLLVAGSIRADNLCGARVVNRDWVDPTLKPQRKKLCYYCLRERKEDEASCHGCGGVRFQ